MTDWSLQFIEEHRGAGNNPDGRSSYPQYLNINLLLVSPVFTSNLLYNYTGSPHGLRTFYEAYPRWIRLTGTSEGT